MGIICFILLIKICCSFGFDIRISGFKGRPHHGRVEVFNDGQWGTVCDDTWDLAAARVVCRQLGFPGTARALLEHEVPEGIGKIWLNEVICNGNESRLSNCSHAGWDADTCYHYEDAGVICDRGIRIEGSKSVNEGQVDVYLNKSWHLVCQDSFDIKAANVACREFGFKEALAISSVFKQEQPSYILSSITCDGTEKRLIECQHGTSALKSCPNKLYAGVICKNNELPIRIRGESADNGQVEILGVINWLPICADRNWDIESGNVVCRELGFPAVKDVSAYLHNQGVPKMNFWKYSIYCNGSEKTVFDCSLRDDLHVRCYKLAEVTCKPALRLVDMNSVNTGRLEAFSGTSWGTVCLRGWTKENGIVACRELGFPGFMSSLPGLNYVPSGSFGKVAYNRLGCLGDEAQLSQCANNFGGKCDHYLDIGIVCNKRIRLSGSNVTTDGRLELFFNGQWGGIFVNEWEMNYTRMACQELGFPDGAGELASSLVPQGSQVTWIMEGHCTGEEMSLVDCLSLRNVSRNREKQIGIKCKPVLPLLRLKGRSSTIGSLQIFHQGEWGSICNEDDVWSDQASKIACRELGFAGFVKQRSETKHFHGIVWAGNLQCLGYESSISECFNILQSSQTCDHWYDVTLQCEPDSRLISTSYSIPEQAIEVYFNGSWGKVCDDGSWNFEDSYVFCKSSGFNYSAKHTGITMRNNHTEKWFGKIACDGNEASLGNCQAKNISCVNQKYLGIECTPGVMLYGDKAFVGRVKVVHDGVWGFFCPKTFLYDEAKVVCRQLGYPGVVSIIPMAMSQMYERVLDDFDCFGDEMKIAECKLGEWKNKSCSSGKVAGLLCQAEVRLQGGPSAYEGFLEIFWKNEWSRTCSPDFTMNEASAICNILDYDKPLRLTFISSNYTGRLWLNNVTCEGSESSLFDCHFKEQNCASPPHYPYIKCGLKESKSTIRIVGSREGEGRVEVLHRGMWGNICRSDWGIEEAEVVCNSLGFPGAFTKDFWKINIFYSEGAIWFGHFECNGQESSLQECKRYRSFCNPGYNVGVICNKGLRLREEGKFSPDLNQDVTGTLEVYYNNSWGVVCSKTWNLNAAQVVCRQLGLPNVVESLTRVSVLSDGKFWLTSLNCDGSETTLSRCISSVSKTNPCLHGKEVQLRCNIASNATVRLFGGITNKEGAVELFSNGLWAAFCYKNWNDNIASVVCRQLGFTGVIRSSLDTFHYNRQILSVSWKPNISCQGDENELSKCKVHGFQLAVCVDHVSLKCQSDIRISGGVNSNNGAVELSHKEEWFPVCGDVWDLVAGSVACRHLHYPTAINVSAKDMEAFSKRESWISIECSGKEDSLNLCQKHIVSRSKCGKVAIVNCDPGIRLAGSSKPNEGRVEIYSRGSWGTICDDGFDMIDAHVICKGLGYVGASTKKVKIKQKADPSMKIHIDTLHCDLSDYFWQCSRYNFSRAVCSHQEDISVSCVSVILEDSSLPNEGRLGIFNGNILSQTISNSHNNEVAEVACRELGFPGALSHYVTRSNELSSLKNIACQGDEHYISECEHTDHKNLSTKASNVLGVICESQVRLSGLDKPNEGRLEVYYEGAWGTVCDDNWDKNNMNGKVACQQLGYPDVFKNNESFYAPSGITPNSLDDVNCKGNERNLFECPHIRGQDSDCDNSEDVGIKCKTEKPGQPIIVGTANGSSTSFNIFIKPPKYPGHIKNIYMYPKLVMNDNDVPIHSAVNRHTYFRHSRNLNVKTSGYYQLYNISISLENDVVEGGATWVLLRTEENVPNAPKFSIETIGNLSDSINVTWEKPTNPNGVITGYIVKWETQDEEITVSGKATIPDGWTNQYLITHLSPNSSYRVQISAVTSKGEGKRSFLIMKTSIKGPETAPTTSSRSNTPTPESSSSSEKISMALAITFGIMLVLVAVFLVLAKTSILKKCRGGQYNFGGDENAFFENELYELPASKD